MRPCQTHKRSFRMVSRGSSGGRKVGADAPEQLLLGACLCFQLLLEFTAGTGKGSHRKVNGLQDKGQSCEEKERRRERQNQ